METNERELFDNLMDKLILYTSHISDAPVVAGLLLTADEAAEFRKYFTIKPERVLFNDPVTVVFWEDGTKTLSKAREGDAYDPMFGMCAAILRKVTKNKGHGVNVWEHFIEFVASNATTADDCRLMANTLNVMAHLMEKEGVTEAIEEFDAADEKPAEEPEKEEKPTESPVADFANLLFGGGLGELSFDYDGKHIDGKDVESYVQERVQERVREMVRNLVDEGEL